MFDWIKKKKQDLLDDFEAKAAVKKAEKDAYNEARIEQAAQFAKDKVQAENDKIIQAKKENKGGVLGNIAEGVMKTANTSPTEKVIYVKQKKSKKGKKKAQKQVEQAEQPKKGMMESMDDQFKGMFK